MNDKKESVISANNEFYLAFDNSDMKKMENLWSREVEVSVIHPGWDILIGLGEVLMSWRQILKSSTLNKISCDNVWVNMVDSVANVTCVEHLDDVDLIATNLFHLESDEWKIIHHQAGPLNKEAEKFYEESTLH